MGTGAGRGAVLRIRDFRLLFVADTISEVGGAFTSVALALGVLEATGSTRDIGLVLAARLVALVALLLIGGAWGDRVPRRTILVISALTSTVSQGAIAALFLTHSSALWSLALLAALNGAGGAFSEPTKTGILPQLVPGELLPSANALFSIVRNSATIGGAALAGVLVAVASPGWALAIDAASYLGSAVLVSRLTPIPAAARDEDSPSIWSELREGWREFTARTWVWAIVVQFAMVNVAIGAAISVYAPVIAKLDLGGPAAYGAITAALGVGGVLGGVIMLRYRPQRPLVSATFGVLLGAPLYALLAGSAPLWSVVAAAVLSGVGVEIFAVLWSSALQHHIPPEVLSRVSAYDFLGSVAFTPIGLAVAGPAAGALGGVHNGVWAALVLFAAPTLLVLAVPDIWRQRR